MIKILYFLNSEVRGGVEEHVLSILDKLDRTKFEPVLVCPHALLELMEGELDKYNVRAYAVSIHSWLNWHEIRKFQHILKKEAPQIVHSHLFKATMFAAPLAKGADRNIRTVDTAHIREAWRKGIKRAFFIDRFIYRRVDEIIAVSHAIKRYLIEEKRLPAEKITAVHNGVHLEKFQSALNRPANGRLTFGVIGRLEPQKGHCYFLEAVRSLGAKAGGADFRIIGEGSLRKELEGQARELGIESRIRFSGYRSDIVQAYDELDVLVLPSLFEGLPLVALEAAAMGKPAIVTNVDGSPEAVAHNETGIVVPARDSGALKEAMDRLIADRGLVATFGRKARERVEREFSVEKQVRETECVYLQVTGNE